MEKFFNIKSRMSGLQPTCAVIVATIRALKMHGGGPPVTAGRPLPIEYVQENTELVHLGTCNLIRHIENAKKFGVKVVVAINKFKNDTDAEIEIVREAAMQAGADDAVMTNHWAEGGNGAAKLGEAVIQACESASDQQFQLLYESSLSIKEKIECICREIYRADGVDYSELAESQMNQYEKSGFSHMPICIAKTQYSFSCDPNAKGAPTGFRVPVREIRCCAGGTNETSRPVDTSPHFKLLNRHSTDPCF
jgi:formyltetrahydrofolate synthetase